MSILGIKCPRCHKRGHVYVAKKKVKHKILGFIPVQVYKSTNLCRCNNCNAFFKIDEKKAENIAPTETLSTDLFGITVIGLVVIVIFYLILN